uniref:Tetratricopeptide repeat protein n=1 Tax=Acidobacterium capsulatum TaxID=33075 RepID=A0A7V5CT45_9BACT
MKFPMSSLHLSQRLLGAALASLLCASTVLAQSSPAASSMQKVEAHNAQILEQHLQAARKAMAAHQDSAAAQQYRIFLADALGELAIARAQAGQYSQAADNFDAALALAPNSPALLVEYARSEFQAGNLPHAKSLAQKVIQQYPHNKNALVRAYSILGRTQLAQQNAKAARKNLALAVALKPNFPNGYNLAAACLALEDQKCAAKIFSDMQASYGDTAVLHMYFGQAYLNSDFQTQAISEFKKAIALNPKLPGAHYSLAAADLATQQSIDKAEDELRKEIAVDPQSALAYAGLGHLETGQQKLSEALTDLQRAAALDPQNPDVSLYLGQLYAAMHKTPEAIDALRRAIANTSSSPQAQSQMQKAHYLLGRLLMQSGQTSAGQKELQIAQSLAQQDITRSRQQLASYYDQNSAAAPANSSSTAALPQEKTHHTITKEQQAAAQAATQFQQHIASAVANSYNNLGALAGAQGDSLSALADFEGAAAWDPTMPGLDENIGRAAFAAGQFSQAIDPLTRYVQHHSDDKSLRAALGISLYMTGDYAKAAAALEPVAVPSPVSNQVAYVYAVCLLKTGKPQPALALLKSLALHLPRSEDVHRTLGEAWAATGHQHQAAQELGIALLLDPNDAAAYHDLGRVQLAQGDTTKAIASLQSAEKLDAANSQIHYDLAQAYRKASQPQQAAREMQQYHHLQSKNAAQPD